MFNGPLGQTIMSARRRHRSAIRPSLLASEFDCTRAPPEASHHKSALTAQTRPPSPSFAPISEVRGIRQPGESETLVGCWSVGNRRVGGQSSPAVRNWRSKRSRLRPETAQTGSTALQRAATQCGPDNSRARTKRRLSNCWFKTAQTTLLTTPHAYTHAHTKWRAERFKEGLRNIGGSPNMRAKGR
jgi:hypothetical protein